MYDRIQVLLARAGLNESEAKMYQNLLTSGVQKRLKDVISECKMTEFTGYRTARRLSERGFVTLEKQGSVKHIKAEPIETIARSVGREQRKLRRLELNLLDIVQSQQSIQKDEQRGIEILSGKEAFLEIYDSLPERSRGELRGFGSLGSIWNVTEADYYSSYEQDWIHRRMRRGVKVILIESEDSIFRTIIQKARREMRDVRLFQREFVTDQWTAIGEREAYVFEADPFTPRVLTVKDRNLLEILKHYFSLLWREAKTT